MCVKNIIEIFDRIRNENFAAKYDCHTKRRFSQMCIICEKIFIFTVFVIFISVLVYHVLTLLTTLFSKSDRKLHRESLEKNLKTLILLENLT